MIDMMIIIPNCTCLVYFPYSFIYTHFSIRDDMQWCRFLAAIQANTFSGEPCFSSIFWGSPVIPNLSFGGPGCQGRCLFVSIV